MLYFKQPSSNSLISFAESWIKLRYIWFTYSFILFIFDFQWIFSQLEFNLDNDNEYLTNICKFWRIQFGKSINDLAAGEELYSDEETRGFTQIVSSFICCLWFDKLIGFACFLNLTSEWKVLVGVGAVEALLAEGSTFFLGKPSKKKSIFFRKKS